MNRSYALLTASVLVAMAFAGCLRPDPSFESPLGTIPKITVDFVQNVTKVYVKALTDYRYENITMRVFLGNVTYSKTSDTYTYVMTQTIKQKEFTLNITVWDQQKDKMKIYCFEANFTAHPTGDSKILLQVSEWRPNASPKITNLKDDDLPWSTVADRIQ